MSDAQMVGALVTTTVTITPTGITMLGTTTPTHPFTDTMDTQVPAVQVDQVVQADPLQVVLLPVVQRRADRPQVVLPLAVQLPADRLRAVRPQVALHRADQATVLDPVRQVHLRADLLQVDLADPDTISLWAIS